MFVELLVTCFLEQCIDFILEGDVHVCLLEELRKKQIESQGLINIAFEENVLEKEVPLNCVERVLVAVF